jgi:hypothetical protein
MIGAIPEFSYTEGLTVSEVTIAAEIGVANRANTVGTYAAVNPEFEGIKRLNFFRYFEEINTLLPVETTFDVSKNMMYTKTDELGTYCIMDMEIWLNSLGEVKYFYDNQLSVNICLFLINSLTALSTTSLTSSADFPAKYSE